MVTSVIDLCNQALSRLGEEPIVSLGDATTAARECNRHYAQTLDEILEDHEWRCAMEYQDLAEVADSDPEYPDQLRYGYVFRLPSDPYCLVPLTAMNADGIPISWEISGRLLLTDSDTVNLRYTKRISNVTHMDAQLAEAVILRMATKMCMTLTANRNLKNELIQEFLVVIRRARITDSSALKTESSPTQWVDVK